MDVLSLLKNDHKTVGALLDRANKCEPGDGKLAALADEIETALTVHAAIEEKYFYPRLHDRADDSDELVDVFEAYTEHDIIKKLIALLRSGRQPDEQFKAEVQVLGESVKHHVKEEESTIFALARQVFDADELEELGAEMKEAKSRLMSRSTARPKRRAATKRSPKKRTSHATARRS
ncbi:MAG TPA: hemerythrin domain-containing protein [Candidatus Cybelea sp.]|jgi:hemerythrin superfamily protein